MKKDIFPIAVPFLGGGVVFLLVAFTSGVMVTATDARNTALAARVDARASICREAAMAHYAGLGEAMPDFTGMAGRQTRDGVAADFLVASGNQTIDRLALQSCSEKLAAA